MAPDLSRTGLGCMIDIIDNLTINSQKNHQTKTSANKLKINVYCALTDHEHSLTDCRKYV